VSALLNLEMLADVLADKHTNEDNISKWQQNMALSDILTVTPCLHKNASTITTGILASMNCNYKKMTIQLALEPKKTTSSNSKKIS
jgi:hypothetical protein